MDLGLESRLSEFKSWLASAVAERIAATASEADKLEIVAWLRRCGAILASGDSKSEKLKALYEIINGRKVLALALESALAGLKGYRDADLPLSIKLALPVTLVAGPFVGFGGAGIVAFGGAIGAPALLLVFLGANGVASIIEALTRQRASPAYLKAVAEFLARDDVLATIRAAMACGEQGAPEEPARAPMPSDEREIRERLLTMDPFAFERHVMSFFQDAGLLAFVTRRSGDKGVDGVARHPSGSIVVQCKRYSPENPVGRPDVQRFWGAIEQHGAWRGYFVSTSRFTAEASETAATAGAKLTLIDMGDLLSWHIGGFSL